MRVLALAVSLLCVAGPAIPAAESSDLARAKAEFLAFRHERALELLEPLARDGNREAQRMLGWMYNNGQGVERDERVAANWYCESVRADPFGDAACPWLVYLTRSQPSVILESLDQSVERWRKYTEEAERGDPEAQVVLGLLLASGLESDRDLVEAYKWFVIAAEQRHPTAGQLLENLESEMTPEQIAEGRRRAAAWAPTPSPD